MKNFVIRMFKRICLIFILSTLSVFYTYPTGIVILLNGTSCSGKTSVAKKLCETILKNMISEFKHIGVDDYYRTKNKSFSSEVNKKKLPFFAAFYDDMHLNIAKLANSNENLIVDHVFSHNDVFCNFLYRLRNVKKVFFVKLYCSYEEALKRLEKRNLSKDKNSHRIEDTLNNHFGRSGKNLPIHFKKHYNFELDTSDLTIEECANKIMGEMFLKNVSYNIFERHYKDPYWSEKIKKDYSKI